jgi:hypothetical protein
MKLRVLFEAAPQAARIACSSLNNNLPLHQILSVRNPPATREQVAMVLAAYREAVNIPNDGGFLPIHYAALFASVDVMKMIAEENMSNLSVILPNAGFFVHLAVWRCSLEHLQYIQSVMPELLLSLSDFSRTPLHYVLYYGTNLFCPLSSASDVLRFLLRHCPGLAATQDDNGKTLYDYLSAEDVGFAYARRLLLLAGASSLHPGVLQEMNYAARREALLLFHFSSSAMGRTIFSLIRNGAGGPELMLRTLVITPGSGGKPSSKL